MNEIALGSFHDVVAVGAKGSIISILTEDHTEYLIQTTGKVILRRGFGDLSSAQVSYPLIGLKLPPTRHVSVDEETPHEDDDYKVRTLTVTGKDGFNLIWKLFSEREPA